MRRGARSLGDAMEYLVTDRPHVERIRESSIAAPARISTARKIYNGLRFMDIHTDQTMSCNRLSVWDYISM